MKTYLGIEFGSTRIKAVLISDEYKMLAESSYEWQDSFENGYWTYSMEEVQKGLQTVYRRLDDAVLQSTGDHIRHIDAMGISAMMHGYLVFDEKMHQLVPFRTWRNTTTGEAAASLSEVFGFNIPQRWSIAHLYQAILNKENHVKDISYMTTLAGYVHTLLTGEKCLGIGDASGMFPVREDGTYVKQYVEKMNILLKTNNIEYSIESILPKILKAGDSAGVLTKEGAVFLDPEGNLEPGVPFCPPEGDAGTGMVCTNAVAPGTGNVSAGTSIFAMAVLQKPLKHWYPAVDVVATPVGRPTAMIHCNTCTSDLNAWVELIREACALFGKEVHTNELYTKLFQESEQADPVCGSLVSVNYFSGEPVTDLADGRPILTRKPDAHLSIANFMKAHLYSAVSTLRIGMDILVQEEHVELNRMCGHGGFFKTEGIGQQIMADALNLPIDVQSTASEGGAWGMAILASYLYADKISLEEYLDQHVFAHTRVTTRSPNEEGVHDFNAYLDQYRKVLGAEKLLAGK